MGRKSTVLLALLLTLLGITVVAQNPNAPRRPVVGRSVVVGKPGIILPCALSRASHLVCRSPAVYLKARSGLSKSCAPL